MFRDCSVHDFDTIRWVTGQEVVEVYAVGANRGAEFFAAAGDVDTAAALLTLDDGTLALVLGDPLQRRAATTSGSRSLGSQDSIAVGLDDRLPLRSVEPGVTFPAGAPYPAFMERFARGLRAELTAFTEVVAGRAEPACTVADALEASTSPRPASCPAHEHRPVRVDEVRR